MAGVLYQWCVGCPHRNDTPKTVSCPADFNPYDDEKCVKENEHDPPENYRQFKKRVVSEQGF